MFDKSLELLVEGKYIAFAFAVTLGLAFNARSIVAFFDAFRKRRIDLLKEATSLSTISENLKSHFEDEIEGEYFRIAHKVKMDKGIRDACVELYLNIEKRIPFSHFINARYHFEAPGGHLRV